MPANFHHPLRDLHKNLAGGRVYEALKEIEPDAADAGLVKFPQLVIGDVRSDHSDATG